MNSFTDIAFPFYNKLGGVGLTLFAVAFACAGISAVVTVGLASVYNTFGLLGFAERMKKRRFKFAFILWLIIAGIASLILLRNQIQIIVFTQFLNGALLPFVIIPLLLFTKDKRIMGKYRLGKIPITLALATIVITTLLFLISLASYVR